MKKMKWGALLVCLLAVAMSIQVFSAQSVMPLAGKTILVDSGHGGKDDGAQRGEVKEDAINLAIAMEVRKQLIEQGANVLMTREDDHDLAEEDSENRKRDDMKKRVEFIECGFCEVNCLTCGLLLSSRQRIVVRREIARLKASGENPRLVRELERGYRYPGERTCAGDGLCSTNYPVGINTGEQTHALRALRVPPGSLRPAVSPG